MKTIVCLLILTLAFLAGADYDFGYSFEIKGKTSSETVIKDLLVSKQAFNTINGFDEAGASLQAGDIVYVPLKTIRAGNQFVLLRSMTSAKVAEKLNTSLLSLGRANKGVVDTVNSVGLKKGQKLFCPQDGSMVKKSAESIFSVSAKPDKPLKSNKGSRHKKRYRASEIEGGSGPEYWRYLGVDPFVGEIDSAWKLFEFSSWPGVFDVLLEKFNDGDYVRDSLCRGKVLIEMIGGRHYHVYGKRGHGVICDWKDPSLVVRGNLYQVNATDNIVNVFKADTCDNWCWWLTDIPAPPPKMPSSDTLISLDTVVIWEEDTIPAAPTPTELPGRSFYWEWYLWLGHYLPLPAVVGGHNYFGGMVNLFWPVGRTSGLGISFKSTGYQGWGPETEISDYIGFYAGLGPIIDLRSNRTRTTLACRYYFQDDWFDRYDTIYESQQLSHLAGPDMSFYLAAADYRRWFEAYAELRQDLDWVGFSSASNHLGKKISSSNGRRNDPRNDPPGNKTVVNWGASWFFWPWSRGNSITFGLGTEGMHLWEDGRWELAVGPALCWRYARFGIKAKDTFHSTYRYQNGWSIKFSLDIDPRHLIAWW